MVLNTDVKHMITSIPSNTETKTKNKEQEQKHNKNTNILYINSEILIILSMIFKMFVEHLCYIIQIHTQISFLLISCTCLFHTLHG